MSTYVLAITPVPIDDADFGRVFPRMVACNPRYEGISWKGHVNFAQVERYGLWVSMLQMNDQSVEDDDNLTVVWSVDPFDEHQDRGHLHYHRHRDTIIRIVEEWTFELEAQRSTARYYDGDVCWVLSGFDTSVLADDFANARRQQLKVIHSPGLR